MSDDHSSATIGAYATTLKDYVQTPNLDTLAQEGAMFTNVVCTNSLCAPSRASILTGLYSHQTGVYTLREKLSTKNIPSIPKVLKSANYQTAVIGKWHIHGDNMYGFDYYAVTKSQGSYWNPTLSTKEGKLRTEGYATDVYTQQSINWLKKRDTTKPFFLMTHYKAAHAPWEFAKRHKDLYKNQTIPQPETLYDDYSNRNQYGAPTFQSRLHKEKSKKSLSFWFQNGKKGKAKTWPTGNINLQNLKSKEKLSVTYQKYIKDYLRVVKGIDEGVGNLIAYLKEEGTLDNTIIIYTSDQGMYIGEHGFFDKRLGLNEAIKMPLIIYYPKKIKAGLKIDQLVNNVDFAKSIIAMSGIAIPSKMNGNSFWDLLQGKEKNNWLRDQSFYGFYSNGVSKHFGLVTKDYKLLKYIDNKGKVVGIDLFDRNNDLNELSNLADDKNYNAILKEMELKLEKELQNIKIPDYLLPGKRSVLKRKK